MKYTKLGRANDPSSCILECISLTQVVCISLSALVLGLYSCAVACYFGGLRFIWYVKHPLCLYFVGDLVLQYKEQFVET
jgi:hypothetical protein